MIIAMSHVIRIVFAIFHMYLRRVRPRSDDDRGTRNIAVDLYIECLSSTCTLIARSAFHDLTWACRAVITARSLFSSSAPSQP